MSTPEEPRVSGTGEVKLQLVLPSLVPPLPGAFEDTCFDYLVNPTGFKVATKYRVQTDNPALIHIFEESPFLPDSDLPYKWVYIYYAMFERAARSQGLPPLAVSRETVDRTTKTHILTDLSDLRNGDLKEHLAKEKAEWERRKTRDREFSPELAKFWSAVEGEIQSQMEEGVDEASVNASLLPVVTIQTLLQKQQDDYSLIGAYSLNNIGS